VLTEVSNLFPAIHQTTGPRYGSAGGFIDWHVLMSHPSHCNPSLLLPSANNTQHPPLLITLLSPGT